VRKRSNVDEQHLQTFTTQQGKRLRIISEQSSLANALNDDEDMAEEVQQPTIATTTTTTTRLQQNISTAAANNNKRDSHSVQPKVESLEFLEESVPTHIQHAQQQVLAKNVTYMNIENFTTADKNTTSVTGTNQQHVVATRKLHLINPYLI
jgi:hypothetical protein